MTHGDFLYNKFDYNKLDQNPQKYHNNNGANFSDPHKQWFFIPYDQWFLNRDEKEPMQGTSSWFDSVVVIMKKATKAIRRKRIQFQDTKIIIAKDQDLLQQYYNLRENLYRKKLGFESYSGQENDCDKSGDILLAVHQGKVVAGARVDFSDRNNDIMHNDNPKENGFTYKDLIKKFDPGFEEGSIYTEVCGLAIDNRVSADFFRKFFIILLDHSKNMGADYLGGIAYPHLFATYESIAQNLNLKLKIFKDLRFNIGGSYGNNKNNLEFFPLITLLKESNFN